MTRKSYLRAVLPLLLAAARCSGDGGGVPITGIPEKCEIPAMTTEAPDFLTQIGCRGDFDLLASQPLDTSIPGARSVKFVLDQLDGDKLYFQNSTKFKIHYAFASQHLSGMGKPTVALLSKFNEDEYYSPSRRFILGSVTYYEGPKLWTVELAPYDTASAKMIEKAFRAIGGASYFGSTLHFHPTSETVEREAGNLPAVIKVRTTRQLFEGIEFQPLNLGTSTGRLRFVAAASLQGDQYLTFRDIVVLDHVPNDLSVTLGIITEEFQTPLSHINVLAQTRKIPNMGLRNAFTNSTLRALDGKWVKLTVGLQGYTVEETSLSEADAWWEKNKPPKATVAMMDIGPTGLWDVDKVVDQTLVLKDALKKAVPAFGGKGTHYAAMSQKKLVPMPRPSGFIIPVYYYDQFIKQNGFDKKIDALMADPEFRGDPRVRDQKLGLLRLEMEIAPVDPAFEKLLNDKLAAEYPGTAIRYRSSSTAEDLDGFAGAGLYTSKTGNPNDPRQPHLRAVREVWASVWKFRGYEERDYRSVDQKAVGMAILAHPAFLDEEATGVAITANPYDPSGLQPGFVINVQKGEASVTLPEPGVKVDQIVFLYEFRGQPIIYLEHSTLVPAGQTVLTRSQIFELGQALDAVHNFFRPAYGTDPSAWYGLEVDFKFDGPPGGTPALFIKQARPYPARGQ